MTRFEQCLAFTLREEGGYIHNPADPGGATNAGITLYTLAEYVGRKCTVAELKAMSPTVRNDIYLRHFWRVVYGDLLPVGIDLMVFDFGSGVTCCPETSVAILQEALNVEADGHVGQKTMAAMRALTPGAFIGILWWKQVHHYRSLPQYPLFGNGWEGRSERRKMAAFAAVAANIEEIAA